MVPFYSVCYSLICVPVVIVLSQPLMTPWYFTKNIVFHCLNCSCWPPKTAGNTTASTTKGYRHVPFPLAQSAAIASCVSSSWCHHTELKEKQMRQCNRSLTGSVRLHLLWWEQA